MHAVAVTMQACCRCDVGAAPQQTKIALAAVVLVDEFNAGLAFHQSALVGLCWLWIELKPKD
jgi:hypothetical protein